MCFGLTWQGPRCHLGQPAFQSGPKSPGLSQALTLGSPWPSPQRCSPTPQASGLGLGSPLARPALLALVTFRPCGCHHNSVPNVTNDSVLPRFLSLVSCKRTQNSQRSLCGSIWFSSYGPQGMDKGCVHHCPCLWPLLHPHALLLVVGPALGRCPSLAV